MAKRRVRESISLSPKDCPGFNAIPLLEILKPAFGDDLREKRLVLVLPSQCMVDIGVMVVDPSRRHLNAKERGDGRLSSGNITPFTGLGSRTPKPPYKSSPPLRYPILPPDQSAGRAAPCYGQGTSYNGKTAFRCYARPEDCEVVIIARKGRVKGSTNPVKAGKPKKAKAKARQIQAKPAPKPSRPKLISYVGCAGQPEWNRI